MKPESKELLKVILECIEKASVSVEVKHYNQDIYHDDFGWISVIKTDLFIQALNEEIEKYETTET